MHMAYRLQACKRKLCTHLQVGSPVIELFLKKDASGELQQQGTALSISPEVLSKMHSSLGKSTEFALTDIESAHAWLSMYFNPPCFCRN